MLEMRETAPEFYKVLDSLMLSNYHDCEIKEGIYVLKDSSIEIDVRLRAFYFKLDPKAYIGSERFENSGKWSNNLLQCGFKLTAGTGKTYSYPKLRDYVGIYNEKDAILRASYFFVCISQTLSFFLDPDRDYGFVKWKEVTERT